MTTLLSLIPAGLWPPPQVHGRQCPQGSKPPPPCSPGTDPSALPPVPGAAAPASSACRVPTAGPVLSGPQPGAAVTAQQSPLPLRPQLPRADSSSCPHTCRAWAGPGITATAACPSSLRSVWVNDLFLHFLCAGWQAGWLRGKETWPWYPAAHKGKLATDLPAGLCTDGRLPEAASTARGPRPRKQVGRGLRSLHCSPLPGPWALDAATGESPCWNQQKRATWDFLGALSQMEVPINPDGAYSRPHGFSGSDKDPGFRLWLLLAHLPLCSGPPRAALDAGHRRMGRGQAASQGASHPRPHCTRTTALKARPPPAPGLPELRPLVQGRAAGEERGLSLLFPCGFQLGRRVRHSTEARNFGAGGADAGEVRLRGPCHRDRAPHRLQRVKQRPALKEAGPKLRAQKPTNEHKHRLPGFLLWLVGHSSPHSVPVTSVSTETSRSLGSGTQGRFPRKVTAWPSPRKLAPSCTFVLQSRVASPPPLTMGQLSHILERAGTRFTAFKLIQIRASLDPCPGGRPSNLPSGEPQAGPRAPRSSSLPGWVPVVWGIGTL